MVIDEAFESQEDLILREAAEASMPVQRFPV
jgi:hypothetical protein